MARVPFSNPNIDRIIDSSYEAFVDRLYDQAYGDHGERCRNCEYFVEGCMEVPCFCNRKGIEDADDDDEFMQFVKENTVDPDDCCEYWEPDCYSNEDGEDD